MWLLIICCEVGWIKYRTFNLLHRIWITLNYQWYISLSLFLCKPHVLRKKEY